MSRSDKNWKNKAIRVIEVEEPFLPSGVELRDVLSVGTVFSDHRGKRTQIRRIEECEGNWRTHVHINGSECWDVRARVYTR